MTTELRLYTVNGGMMDSWLQLFSEKVMPTAASYGVKVHVAFVNRPQNEFIWVRSYETPEILAKYESSPERAAYSPETRRHLAKMEVRQVEVALGEVGIAS